MRPTNIQIRKLQSPKGKVLAFVEVTFDELLIVRDLKIINGEKGLFVAMPSKPSGKNDNKFFDTVYIVDSFKDGTPGREYKNKLQAAILKKWSEMNDSAPFEDQTASGGGSAFSDDVPF